MEAGNVTERRKFPRVEVKVPVRFQEKESGERGSSITQNISYGGTQILSNIILPVDKNLLMEIFLVDRPVKTVNAVAKVIWNRQIPYTDRYHIGLEFSQISEKARDDLIEFIDRRINVQF